MLKKMLFVVALLPMSLIAQVAGKVGHSEVVEVKGAAASTLTSRANTFLTKKKIEAKTAGTVISGTGTFIVAYPSIKFGTDKGNVHFNLKLMVKDGKYKMDLTDFKHEGMHGKSSGGSIDLEKPECGEVQLSGAAWGQIKEQTLDQLQAFVMELKKNLDNPTKAAAPSSDF